MSFAGAFREQAAACAELGSPFTARLLMLAAARLAPGGAVADRLLGWPGDMRAGGDAVPLRLAGALHALVLGGQDAALAEVWPPREAEDEALWAAVAAALVTHEAQILHWLDSPPQTNEVRRAAALIVVGHLLAARYGLALRLSELGASAGLNLFWDRYALEVGERRLGPEAAALRLGPEWEGPLPLRARPEIADRRGVDLNPLSPAAPEDRLRLAAYTWPDQPDRLARLGAALSLAAPVVDTGDAGDWLAHRLAAPIPGQVDFVFHTIAWQYFPEAARAACVAALEARGAAADMQSPLAWLSVEADGGRGAAMVLRLWPGDGHPILLGRMDFHGRWLDWRP